MNKNIQVRNAVVSVERAELARALAVHFAGIIMNTCANLNSDSGAEVWLGSKLKLTVDGEVIGEDENRGFIIDYVVTAYTDVERIILTRHVDQPEDGDTQDLECIIVRCEGGQMQINVDQKIYVILDDDDSHTVADFLD
jgi:hypothetical protein